MRDLFVYAQNAVSAILGAIYRYIVTSFVSIVSAFILIILLIAPAFAVGFYGMVPDNATLTAGKVGSQYSQQFYLCYGGSSAGPHYCDFNPSAEDGGGWDLVGGVLPRGMSLSGRGLLSGVPEESGTFTFTVFGGWNAANTGGWSPWFFIKEYRITIAARPAITINPVSLPSGKVGLNYGSQQLSATGGTAPYTYKTSGTLPPGLTLNASTGVFSGTPSAAGTYSFWLGATDAEGFGGEATGTNGWREYTIVIAAGPVIEVGPAILPGGKVGRDYVQQLSASGGTAPYTYKVGAGTLPPGLSFSQTGKLEGTPTQAGTFSFWLGAEDADGYGGVVGESNGWQSYTLTIAAAPTIVISPAILPSGKVGLAYPTQTLSATGGTSPYRFSVTGLPAGLALSGDQISGTPTTSGNFSVSVTAADAENYSVTKTYTVRIAAAPVIAIGPASLPSGKVGLTYPVQTLSASGGTAPYRYKVFDRSKLPPGLDLDSNTGRFTGTPSAAGSYTFWLGATDSEGYGGEDTGTNGWRQYTVTMAAAPTFTISPASLPNGMVGLAYAEQTLTATGGTGPYTFTATGLPAGLTLSGNKISGTPTTVFDFDFSITATDSEGYRASKTYHIQIYDRIVISPAELPGGKVGLAYAEQTLTALGGTGPYSFEVTGLPAGLAFSNGKISGTPTVSGSFTVNASVTDAEGFEASKDYTVTIAAAPVIAISPDSLPSGQVGRAYAEQTLTASGGTGPYTFEVSDLPSGLGFAGNKISGTPTRDGLWTVSVTATDAEGYSGTHQYTLVIAGVLISPATLPSGQVGRAYELTLSANGGTAPHSFAVTGGALPAGLSLASDGTLSGTPTEAGQVRFTVTARDANGYQGSKIYPLSIAAAPTIDISPTTLPSGKVGLAFAEQALTASGGTGPYTFEVSGLPSGLGFAGNRISGTPTQAGTSTVSVTATDAEGYTGTHQYTLMIAAAPVIAISPDSLPSGKVGLAYAEQTLTASGGTGPYSFEVTGLPAGLAFSNGKISGTPTVSGSFTVSASVTDAEGFEATKDYTVTIAAVPVIAISPAELPGGKVGLAYAEQTLTALGGTGPYSFEVTGLPAGLAFSNGKISGTPTVSGSFTVSASVTDAEGFEATKDYTVTIAAVPVIAISPAELPGGKVGLAYAEQTLTALGGTGPYSFEVTGLPAGLAFSNGKIIGTPTVSGSFTVSASVTDAEGFEATKDYTVTIAAVPVIAISPAELPGGKVGLAYAEQTLTALGGTGPYSFEVTGLPAGLAFSNGKISGTPTASGSFTVNASVTDAEGFEASKDYTVTIAAAPVIAISPATLPSGKVGATYHAALSASGGTGPYSFAVRSGALPAGLSLAADGTLTGASTAAGNSTFSVTATDADGYTGTNQYTLVVAAAPVIAISPDSLPSGKIGLAYAEQSLTASGGTGPYTFEVTGLPAGLAFSNGKISGTPTVSGSFTVSASVSDAEGFEASKDYTINIEVNLPEAQAHAMSVVAGTTNSVELTKGAIGGPIRYARIITAPDAAAGNAWIVREGDGYMLHFGASATFAGATQLVYSLSNDHGTSAPAIVTINVIARPDPSKDEEVIGLVHAQTEATNQLAKTQIRNFNQRLEQLHNEGECRANSINVNLGLEGAQLRPSLDALGKISLGTDARECNELQRKLSMWTTGEISVGDTQDSFDNKQKHTGVGISGGIDYRFSPSFVGGLGFGYGRDIADIGIHGTRNRASMLGVAAYGSYHPAQNIFLDGVIGHGWLQLDSSRYVTATGEMAEGERTGRQIFGSLTMGYEHREDQWLLSPYARLDAARTTLNSFSETGGGIHSLTFGEQSINYLATTLGVRGQYTIPMDWGALKPRARVEYTHDFSGTSRARIGYADVGGLLPYIVDAKSTSQDLFRIEAGFDAEIHESWSMGFDYSTEIASSGGSLRHGFRWKLSKEFK